MWQKLQIVNPAPSPLPACVVCGEEPTGGLYIGGGKLLAARQDTVLGCWGCLSALKPVRDEHDWAVRDEHHQLESRIRLLEQELAMAQRTPDEQAALLRLERARLNFLSMDMISSQAGYDAVSVTCHTFGDGPGRQVQRTNVRQAVDVLAATMYGDSWVDIMLAHGAGQRYEDMHAPEGMNAWHDGPPPTVAELAAFYTESLARSAESAALEAEHGEEMREALADTLEEMKVRTVFSADPRFAAAEPAIAPPESM